MDNGTNMMNGGGMDWLILLLLLFGRNGLNGLGGTPGVEGISNEFQMTQGKLDGITASTNAGFANTQMGFAAVAQQLSKCCCDTQLLIEQRNNDTNRHIDNVLFDLASKGTTDAQRIVDRVDALQDGLKDQRIHDLETQLGACNTRDTVGTMISPILAQLASIQAQMNCGVKAVQYTPSLPVTTPFVYGAGPVPYAGYGGGVPFYGPCGSQYQGGY